VAQLELGKAYFNATFIEGNFHTSFKWISLSAEQGNMEAQFRLGDPYALGHGTLKSMPDAYRWYTKAAIQGYKKALIRIHNLYQDDTRIRCRGQTNSEEKEWRNYSFKYCKYFRELNEYRLEHKKPILNNVISYYTEQFKHYQSSNQEDPTVQLNIAFLYQHGYGVKKCIRWAFEYYAKAAEQGNVEAQYNLGNLYQKHPKMKFNYRHAFKWYTASVQGESIAAQRSLAYFYLKGLATDIDHDTALLWYTKAAESGDTESQVILGKLYRKGDYIKQDLPMAVKWYSRSARQGNVVAQNCLSQLYQRGVLNDIELDQDMTEYFRNDSMEKRLCTKLSMDIIKSGDSLEFKQLEELAKRALIGDGHAMYNIGLKYYQGDKDFMQDQDTGIKWIKNAANANHEDAQSMIAEIYKKGDSIEQDYYKAALWYKRIAKQKNAAAQCNVGVMYKDGLGVRKDPLEASKWFIWAAEQGDSNAQFYLSQFRFDGVVWRKDEKEGLYWLNKSVCQRNIKACYTLSTFYFKGQCDLDQDIESGLLLLKFTAKNGFIQAQLDMAIRYQYGNGVQQDIQKCIKYYEMACDGDSGEAEYELAMRHLLGNNIPQDYLKGYDLMKRANDKGYSEARKIFKATMWNSLDMSSYFEIIDMFIYVTENDIDDLHYLIGYYYETGLYDSEFGGYYVDRNYTEAAEWFLAASNNGDSRAAYRLGMMHEYGEGVYENMDKAIYYYEVAFSKGNTDAGYRLACFYLDGYGGTQDSLMAFYYYENASSLGHKEANKAVNIFKDFSEIKLYRDDLFDIDPQIYFSRRTQVNMLEKATEEGYTQLQYQIGVWYDENDDDSIAFKWLSRAANIGVTDAYYRVGVLYEEGRGVEQNYRLAADMYHKATEKEHEDACYRLGRLYQYGNGVGLNYLKAYQFYKKAQEMGQAEAHEILNITLETTLASNGDTEVKPLGHLSQEYQDSLSMCKYVANHGDIEIQFHVGFAYEYIVSKPDYVEAFNWYSMAAESSHREAIYYLGLLYEKGLGIPQDYQKAIQLYNYAGHLGSDKALYQLGVAYHDGNGVDIDPTKAIEYYTRSANLGNPEYQCFLGRLYEEGQFVQKDPQEALKWCTKAYLQGYDDVSSNLYAMYDDKLYEDFFYTKLFRNIYIASCGHFRLNEDYSYFDYCDLNYRLAILCALGRGTEKNSGQAWAYIMKTYSDDDDDDEPLLDFLNHLDDFSVSDKLDILKGLEENEKIMNQLEVDMLSQFAIDFYNSLTQIRQNGCNKIQDQGKVNSTQDSTMKKDYSRAFHWTKKAADMEFSEAMIQLGVMYCSGHGVEKDTEQGERWFNLTMNRILYNGLCVGMLFHTSEDMRDFTLAHKWYISKLNSANAHLGLGLLYEYGDGVEQDYQKALEYYTKLADDDIPVGMLRLGLMHYYGKGVPVDYRKSFDLFESARYKFRDFIMNQLPEFVAFKETLPYVYNSNNLNGDGSQDDLVYCLMDEEQVVVEVYYYLGLQYKYGQGIPVDKDEAQLYLREAFSYGCKRSECELDD
jgi:TPR repeat protein